MRAIVGHGGVVGTSREAQEGCQTALGIGMELLRQDVVALEGVVPPVVWMEGSCRYNAGGGSVMRRDRSIRMDATVAMTTAGSRVAVATVIGAQGVLYPILVARAVLEEGRHVSLTGGEDVLRIAQERGIPPHPGPSQFALARWQQMLDKLRTARREGRLAEIAPGWPPEEIDEFLRKEGGDNGDFSIASTQYTPSDTVGVIALDSKGGLALAASTGGIGLMDPTRVGDVPFRGQGFEIGADVAVLATGPGEQIMQEKGSAQVYDLVVKGLHPQQACEHGVLLFPRGTRVGFIALTSSGLVGVAPCRDLMPSYSIVEQ